jgi:hypothetical protein
MGLAWSAGWRRLRKKTAEQNRTVATTYPQTEKISSHHFASWHSDRDRRTKEYVMTQTLADTATVENACRDIDRYVAETSQPPSHDQPISPSQRLRALGRQQAGSLQPPTTVGLMETATVGLMETPLFANKP